MWPWEHVLFAYVFYSVYSHLGYRTAPADGPAAALAFGALLPDLVDKPLGWQFGYFPTGWGPAHSVLVAVPVVVLVAAIARWRGAGQVGVAFGFGYLLHLPGDVIPASLGRGRFYPAPVLWPISSPTVDADHGSLLSALHTLLLEYAGQLLALEVTPILALQLGSVLAGGLLWLADGRPGLGLFTGLLRSLVRGVRRA